MRLSATISDGLSFRRSLEAGRACPMPNSAKSCGPCSTEMHELRASWTRALALNPNFAHAWIHGGLVRVRNQQGLAIEALQYAMRLSPLGSPGCFPGVAIN